MDTMDIDNVNIDLESDLTMMNELRYLCVKKYMDSMYSYTTKVSIHNIKLHYNFVDNCSKKEIINYLLYE